MCSDQDSCGHGVLLDDIQSLAPEPSPSTPAYNKTTCLVECNTAEILAVSRFGAGWPAMLCTVSTCSSWLSSTAVENYGVVELRSS